MGAESLIISGGDRETEPSMPMLCIHSEIHFSAVISAVEYVPRLYFCFCSVIFIRGKRAEPRAPT